MTESTFPSETGDDVVADSAEEPAKDSRRNVLALGALAAVAVAAGGFFLLGGSGAQDPEIGVPLALPRAAAPAVTPAPKRPVTLPVASKVQLGRNPFKALYVAPAAAPTDPGTGTGSGPATATGGTSGTGAASDTGGTSGSTGTGSTGSDSTSSSGSTSTGTGGTGTATAGGSTGGGTATGGSTGGTSPSKPTVREYRLVLRRVYGTGEDRTAVFTVDGKQMTAKVGSTFGPTAEIKLLSLQEGPDKGQWTAVLQVGDGDPFDVVTGVAVYVR